MSFTLHHNIDHAIFFLQVLNKLRKPAYKVIYTVIVFVFEDCVCMCVLCGDISNNSHQHLAQIKVSVGIYSLVHH